MWESSGPFVKDPSGIWVLPEGEKAIMPLSGTALGAPPSSDPTRQDWAGGFSQALAALDPSVQSYLNQKVEALGVGIGTLRSVWTEMTEVEPGVVPAFNAAKKVADVVIGLANEVFGLSSSISDVSGAVDKALGSAAGVIPLLGTVIQMVLDMAEFFSPSDAQVRAWRQEAERLALEQIKSYCQSQLTLGKVVGTGPGGTGSPTPADLFADIARKGPGHPLPYNLGGMYVLLCLPETEGYGGGQDAYRSSKLNKVNWIPAREKRIMWQIVKGIMAARAPSGYHQGVSSPLTTDHGRALMPYLQELVRRYGPKPGGGRGWWDHNFTRRAAYVLGGSKCASARAGNQSVVVCSRCDTGGMTSWWGEDPGPGFIPYDRSIGQVWNQSIISWQNQVAYDINPKWREHAAKMNAEAAENMRGLLSVVGTQRVLSSAAASEKAFDEAQQEVSQQELRDKLLRGAAGLSGATAAGYLAWTGMRKFGPKRRRA